MATFTRPPLNGISLSDAIIEAAVVAPTEAAVLRTYEIRNYFLAEPLRIVHSNSNLTATLEAGAPVNAGETVTFYACSIEVALAPESPTDGTPEIDIMVTNVNAEITNLLEMSRYSFETWEITERVYLSDDLSSPAKLPPLTLTITSATMNGKTANMKASFGDSINLAVPRLTYSIKEYPGLMP